MVSVFISAHDPSAQRVPLVSTAAVSGDISSSSKRGVPHEGPVEHDGGDRSVYFKDPGGNVIEAWDFFEQGEGRRDGVDALR